MIHTRHTLITPAAEPVLTIAEAKAALRFGAVEEDGLIQLWIEAASQLWERLTGRPTITATYEYWLERFPCTRWLDLPRAPVQYVSTLSYLDTDGVRQTVNVYEPDAISPSADSDFRVEAPQGPLASRGRLYLTYGSWWPVARCEPGSIRIRYLAGYGATADTVDPLIRTALMLLVSHFWTNRTEVEALIGGDWSQVPIGAGTIMANYRLPPLPELD